MEVEKIRLIGIKVIILKIFNFNIKNSFFNLIKKLIIKSCGSWKSRISGVIYTIDEAFKDSIPKIKVTNNSP